MTYRSMLRGNSYIAPSSLDPELLRSRYNEMPERKTDRYTHGEIRKLAKLVQAKGFRGSVVVDDQGFVVAGWELVLVALHLRLPAVPVRALSPQMPSMDGMLVP